MVKPRARELKKKLAELEFKPKLPNSRSIHWISIQYLLYYVVVITKYRNSTLSKPSSTTLDSSTIVGKTEALESTA